MEQLLLIKKQKNHVKYVHNLFSKVTIDKSWSFIDSTTKDTKYISHGYHRYPAKFIPQLARRLIENYTIKGDLVVDPFMGSGTTLVEAKILGRPSKGVDINDVAFLISKTKVTPIEPKRLEDESRDLFLKINEKYNKQNTRENINISQVADQSRIDYWFKPDTKSKLLIIYDSIKEISNAKIQAFFLCGFSHILKNCSIWLMKSNKPTRDLNKIIPDPYDVFNKHIRQMLKKNNDFWNLLHERGTTNCSATPYQKDARSVPVDDNTVSLVVTSPPYVTSYEYADLHQLTALWLEYADNLSDFRKKFIGSAHNNKSNIEIESVIGEKTIEELRKNNTKKDKEVAVYFSEMRESFIEMHRYLKPGGKACIVIGNTAFRKVAVPNAEVFVEQMLNKGFKTYKIIKREIPSKILPSTRDSFSGRFTASNNKNKTLAYPYEYIIIMEKKMDKKDKITAKCLEWAKRRYDEIGLTDPSPYRKFSAILKEVEIHFKDDEHFKKLKKPDQSWRKIHGEVLEGLIEYSLEKELAKIDLICKKPTKDELKQNYDKMKEQLEVPFGDKKFLPDADRVVYQENPFDILAILSIKKKFRERIAQVGYWTIQLRDANMDIKNIMVTTDEDGTFTKPKLDDTRRKAKAIAKKHTNGTFVATEAEIQENGNVKKFEKIIKFLENLKKNNNRI